MYGSALLRAVGCGEHDEPINTAIRLCARPKLARNGANAADGAMAPRLASIPAELEALPELLQIHLSFFCSVCIERCAAEAFILHEPNIPRK